MLKQTHPALAYAVAHLDEDVSLATLARQVGLSPYHFHRAFADAIGETPKQITVRLRLDRAAAMLLTTGDTVLDIALACGFQSHEVFCRTFRTRFKITPRAYRKRGFSGPVDAEHGRDHAAIVDALGPCVGLYGISEDRKSRRNSMEYSIVKKDLAPQPVLLMRRRVKRSDIAATIAEALPHVFVYAQQNGIALTGLPLTRYVEVGYGMVTMEPAMRIATPHTAATTRGSEVIADTLPGGMAVTTTHIGPYDKLQDAYAALEQWMEAEGLVAAGAPWESYITDPGDFPDPKDWKTEVFWPVRS